MGLLFDIIFDHCQEVKVAIFLDTEYACTFDSKFACKRKIAKDLSEQVDNKKIQFDTLIKTC